MPLYVPADAQIIIEGWIGPSKLEMEAPFGKSYGNMSVEEYNHSIEVTAITRRKKAPITSMISQMAPSESGVIKQLNYSAVMLNHRKSVLYIRQVKDVALPKKEIMEEARELWTKAGLPPVTPRWKWYGYSLGDWCDEWTRCADRAVAGEWLINGLRTARLVDTDPVGEPTAGVPRKGVVGWNEKTGQVDYPEGFPLRDLFNTDE